MALDPPVARVTSSGEPPSEFWEPNFGPLEEQCVLLTTEPPLQPLYILKEQGHQNGWLYWWSLYSDGELGHKIAKGGNFEISSWNMYFFISG